MIAQIRSLIKSLIFNKHKIIHVLLRNDRRQMVTNHDEIGSPPRASNHDPLGQ